MNILTSVANARKLSRAIGIDSGSKISTFGEVSALFSEVSGVYISIIAPSARSIDDSCNRTSNEHGWH